MERLNIFHVGKVETWTLNTAKSNSDVRNFNRTQNINVNCTEDGIATSVPCHIIYEVYVDLTLSEFA